MRKRWGFLVALVVVGVLGIVLFYPRDEVVQEVDVPTVLSSVTVEVPDVDVPIVLSSGSAELPPEGSGGYVKVGAPYEEVGSDAFAIMSVNYGGSGVFEYLVMFTLGEDGVFRQSGLYSLGDRVVVESIEAQGEGRRYSVLVTYLTHTDSQSYADAPTEKITANVPIVNHSIQSNDLTPGQ